MLFYSVVRIIKFGISFFSTSFKCEEKNIRKIFKSQFCLWLVFFSLTNCLFLSALGSSFINGDNTDICLLQADLKWISVFISVRSFLVKIGVLQYNNQDASPATSLSGDLFSKNKAQTNFCQTYTFCSNQEHQVSSVSLRTSQQSPWKFYSKAKIVRGVWKTLIPTFTDAFKRFRISQWRK